MAIKDVKDAFNLAASPYCVCTNAYLYYDPIGGVEWQRIELSVINADGSPARILSERLNPKADPTLAAKEMGLAIVASHQKGAE